MEARLWPGFGSASDAIGGWCSCDAHSAVRRQRSGGCGFLAGEGSKISSKPWSKVCSSSVARAPKLTNCAGTHKMPSTHVQGVQ